MSALCGYVGEAAPAVLTAMLEAASARGGTRDTHAEPGFGCGVRAASLTRHAHGLTAIAGDMYGEAASPALLERALLGEATALAELDGAFAAAAWDRDARTLRLLLDPFGVRGLAYAFHQGVFYFASELKQLLAVPGLDLALDHSALHKYLTFSFVPGEATPLRAVRRLLPGHRATLVDGRLASSRWFELEEAIDPALADDENKTVRRLRSAGRRAVEARLPGAGEVGLYLSGGVDSAAVGVWLKRCGAQVRAFTLDFGAKSVEREQAIEVARHLAIPLERVPVTGEELSPETLDALVHALDLPFGDAVTGPQFLLALAARRAGLDTVFNGEGGDQLFGGWTSKPMVAAAMYGDLFAHESREELYLQSYHRFYGKEEELYSPAFRAAVGGPGQRRALLAPYLGSSHASTFLNRMRLADIALKGSQNILPRAERIAGSQGLSVRMPLFDRRLAELSFRIPPQQKLHGACEKYVFKRSLSRFLPDEIVWRRKYGMSVPVTDWTLGPLNALVAELLGPGALARRGLFDPRYVERLRHGQDDPGELRRRRIGEKLWTLVMLEAWLRVFVDRRGRLAP
jgi:asparagine synthase (glutamine-hydrolysing)